SPFVEFDYLPPGPGEAAARFRGQADRPVPRSAVKIAVAISLGIVAEALQDHQVTSPERPGLRLGPAGQRHNRSDQHTATHHGRQPPPLKSFVRLTAAATDGRTSSRESARQNFSESCR